MARSCSTPNDPPASLLAVDPVPTSRMTGWTNSTPTPAPLTPNLLARADAYVAFQLTDRPRELKADPRILFDGQPDPPAQPWFSWSDDNLIDSGWQREASILIDTWRTQLRVTGVTFVEDAAHPESWLRDCVLQYWNAANERWETGPTLLSDATVHTHTFAKPIEAARFRIVKSNTPGTWPVGNVRLGELVFHGEAIGCSHPDVQARRPVAVLFDENENDVKCIQYPNNGFSFKFDGAFSGGRCMMIAGDKAAGASYHPKFGHSVPGWDFEIVENPQPGQYRWLQFAWKALAPETKGVTLRIAPDQGGGIAFHAGAPTPFEMAKQQKIADAPPAEWIVVRVDLWQALGKPARIRSLGIGAIGGPGAFDQILLGRSEGDLPR